MKVTPDGTTVEPAPNTSKTQSFTLHNVGNDEATFTLQAQCAGTAKNCSTSKTSVTLAGGASTSVQVSYEVGASGTAGTVQLEARHTTSEVRDVGFIRLRVQQATSLAVDVESVNPGTAVARDLCVTIAVGPDAAAECGDLRLTQALPSTRTLNKERTPTLIYNSQLAHPQPTVAADVTLGTNTTTTDSIVAVLKVGSANERKARQKFPGSQWKAGETRRITLPVPAGAPARTYSFDWTWSADSTRVKITAPPVTTGGTTTQRIATLSFNYNDGRTRVVDPDGHAVTYHYYDSASDRITRRTDRRGNVVAYEHDAAGKLRQVRRYMSGPSQGPNDLITTLSTVEARTRTVARASDSLYTRLDGPRTDVNDYTFFFTDRWGAPTKIRDALGGETVLDRTDGRFPGLVTRVAYPVPDSGPRRIQLTTYTKRGNLETTTEVNPYGDGRTATTRYRYTHDKWRDFVTRIVPPLGDSIVIGYDARGRRAWQQDARGEVSRVSFGYGGSGPGKDRITSIDAPLTPPRTLAYDTYGNLKRVNTPIGFVSESLKDNIGRDTLVLTPTDSAQTKKQKQRIRYDLMDRVRSTETIGPALNSAPQRTRMVQHFYNPEGAQDSLRTWSVPDVNDIDTLRTRWRYDRAGRIVKEIAADGKADSTVYDPAGNPTRVITRRGDTITMEYDELNRLTERKLPAFTYAARFDGIPEPENPSGASCAASLEPYLRTYPSEPNDGECGYRIPADVALFDYDALGNITVADNGNAKVRRTYYPGGALKTETQKIRTVAGNDFSTHSYTLEYRYDLNGRRAELIHPAELRTGAPRNATSYRYDPRTGALETVIDLLGNRFGQAHDEEGRLELLTRPGEINAHYFYDDDGRLQLEAVAGVLSRIGDLFGGTDLVRAVEGRDPHSGSKLGAGTRIASGAIFATNIVDPSRGLARGLTKAVKAAQGATVAFRQAGRFVVGTWEVAGRKGAGYARWNRVLNAEGRTVRLYKDVYDQGGDYLRRDWYVGGPKR